MKAIVIHAAKDLRIEETDAGSARTRAGRNRASRPAASAAPTFTTTIMAASARSGCASR